MVQLEPIKQSQQIKQLVSLATEIWDEYFPAIIGQPQVDHMLQKFQSEQAISQKIAEGHNYFFITLQQTNVGYVSFIQNQTNNVLELSKFYVCEANRNSGIGCQVMALIKQQAAQAGLVKIVLKVNRDNTLAINAYVKYGFNKVGESVVDIGDGFVMDDFVLEYML